VQMVQHIATNVLRDVTDIQSSLLESALNAQYTAAQLKKIAPLESLLELTRTTASTADAQRRNVQLKPPEKT